jgi:hypothetical protein
MSWKGNRDGAEKPPAMHDVADGPDIQTNYDSRLRLGPTHHTHGPQDIARFPKRAGVMHSHLRSVLSVLLRRKDSGATLKSVGERATLSVRGERPRSRNPWGFSGFDRVRRWRVSTRSLYGPARMKYGTISTPTWRWG